MRKNWRIYRTRPKTISKMFSRMKSVGINPSGLTLEKRENSHSAPLGKKSNWANPEKLNAFSGILNCSPVKGFNYGSRAKPFAKPWDKLWWIHSGSGGGDGNGKWFGSFIIWYEDVPEVTREWEKMAENNQCHAS